MSFLRSTRGAAVIIGCFFVFGALYFFAGRRTERAFVTGSVIGSVNRLVGEAEIRPARALAFEPLKPNTQLYGGELIVVHEASEVTLGFGQATIRLQPGARLVTERDSSRASGAIRATLLSGEAQSLTTSPLFRLVKEGRDITGASAKLASDSAVLITRASPLPANLVPANLVPANSGTNEVVVAATVPIETPTPVQHPTARMSDEIDATSKESLSNEEIRRAVGVQSGFYRRCYLTYLNRAKQPSPKGETVTVGFVVANSGKVRDAKVVRSTVNDVVLTKCVLETVERTPFRAFKASDIPVLEFPIELK